jgi:hypothetical protein
MGKLKYMSGGQNKNFWNKFFFWNGPKYIDFFHVLPALEHHTYCENDVEEGGIKIKKIFSWKLQFFLGRIGRKKGKK